MFLKKYLIAGFLIFFLHSLSAQDVSLVKELREKLAAAKTDTDRVKLMATLTVHYCNINSDTALNIGTKGLQLAEKINFPKGIASCYNGIGWCYFTKGEYGNAENYLLRSITLFDEVNDAKNISIPLSNLGWVYVRQKKYADALKYFNASLKSAEKIGNHYGEAIALRSIGVIYNEQKNFSEAKKYFLRSAEMLHDLEYEVEEAKNYLSLGNAELGDKNFNKAESYQKKALEIFKKENDYISIGFCYESLGEIYEAKNEKQKVIEYLQTAIKYFTKAGELSEIAYAYGLMAATYADARKFPAAIDASKNGLMIALNNNDKVQEADFYSKLSNIYDSLRDYDNAHRYFKKSVTIKDSLFTKESRDELLKLQTQFETERKEKENQQLKAQNNMAEAALQRNYILLGAALIVIGLITIWLWLFLKSNHKLKELNEKLNQKTEEISRINKQLELRALRSQINPHFIYNCMGSVQDLIYKGDADQATEYVGNFSRLLRLVLENAENNYISLEKEISILTKYLELETIRLMKKFNYAIHTDEKVAPDELYVPALLLQPFAENAIWHGLLQKEYNRQLKIQIKQSDGLLICTIEDNGIGRGAAQKKEILPKHTSKGMMMIEERLRLIREECSKPDVGYDVSDIFDETGKACGTKVVIKLPVIYRPLS